MRGAGLRYDPTDSSVPEWARGKTADEILALSQTFYNAAMTGSGAPAQPQAPQQAPTPTAQSPAPDNMQTPRLPSPDLQYNDPAEYERQMQAYISATNQQALSQFAQPFIVQQSQLARAEARRDSRLGPIWDKYAGEIDAQMASVPMQHRTVDAWQMAAKIVAGDHLDELASERAAQLAARPDTGTVSSGDNLVPAGSEQGAADAIAELFRDDHPAIQRFKKIGKRADDVRKHAIAMGHTPEKYAEMLKNRTSITVHQEVDGQTEAVVL